MNIIHKNRIIFRKSEASVLMGIIILSTTAVLMSPLQSRYAQAESSSPQPTNRLVNNSNATATMFNASAKNMTPGIVIAKNVKAPPSANGTFVRTIGIKNLKNIKVPSGVLNRTFPLGPLPPGDIPEVIHAKNKQKIPINPQRPTLFSQPPTNLTANNTLFNNSTLFKGKVGIRELGAFLLHINSKNVTATQHTKNNTPSVNNQANDPLFVNTIAGFNGLTKCTTLPAPGGGTSTRCSWPPDVQLAAGPNHVMELVNQVGEIFTKQGSSVSTFFLSSFFGTPTNDFLTDPKIMYDALSGRWFVSIADFTTVSVLIAVSTSMDPTLTPGGWKIYNFPFSNCPDQPKIGFNDDKLAVTTNIFARNPTCQSPGGFLGLQYYIISKSDLINGVATPKQQQSNVDNTIFSVNPVQSLSSISTLFMVTVGSQQSTSIVLSSVSGTVPNTVRTDTMLSIFLTHQPPGAKQRGTTTLLDTGDARIQDASWYQGKLWLTFNDGCTPTGDTQLRSCFRLDQIDTPTNSIVLPELEQGTSGFDYFYPALRIDSSGNLNVLFGYSSINNYPSLAGTGVAVGTHTMDSPVNFVVGSGPDTEDCDTTAPCSVVRYGDYFGAGLDPTNPSIIWAAGEYHSTAVGWLTFIGQTTRSNVWSGYSSLGGSVLGDPAVARNSDGRLEVFLVGSNHALYHKSETLAGSSSGWTDYSSLGGYIIGNPVVGQNSDGRLEIFVIGSDHALYHESQVTPGSSTWSSFTRLGGYFISDPAVARNSDGRLEVFAIGSDHSLSYEFQTTAGSDTWSGFANLGGYVISNPVVAQNSDGRLVVFVIGTSHSIFNIFQLTLSSSTSWSAFNNLGGYIVADPAVAKNFDGRLQAFVIGSDHALYTISQVAASSSTWSGFSYLAGSMANNTKPAAALNSGGQLQAFVIATNNAVFYKFQITPGSTSWTGYVGLGGFVIGNPVVATNSDGRLELFIIGSNHALYHNFQLS